MTEQLLTSARAAQHAAPPVGDPAYRRYCGTLADQLADSWPLVLKANAEDVATAERRGLGPVLVDRLRLTEDHLDGLVRLCRTVAGELDELTGRLDAAPVPIDDWGARRKVAKPLGVVFMVYEARPTVTVEGALLPVVVGNSVLLRGGKEMAATDAALADAAQAALGAAGLPAGLVSVVDDPDRKILRELLRRPDAVDVLVPRGSASLIDYCRSASTVPVIASGGGVNHLYVHRSADLAAAAAVAVDSKIAEPTACNTLELVLVDEQVADAFVAELVRTGADVTVKLGGGLRAEPAGPVRIAELAEHDLGREFLESALGVLPVPGVDAAVEHIRRYGSAHTEGVFSEDAATTERFTRGVDAAAVVVNGSLRLHDGPTMGLGSELSISTGRLHVRGSVTISALLTHTWVIEARGALRAGRGNR